MALKHEDIRECKWCGKWLMFMLHKWSNALARSYAATWEKNERAGFEVFTAMLLKIQIF